MKTNGLHTDSLCCKRDAKLLFLIVSSIDGMRLYEKRRIVATDYLATVEIDPGTYDVEQDGKRFSVCIDGSSTATVVRVW